MPFTAEATIGLVGVIISISSAIFAIWKVRRRPKGQRTDIESQVPTSACDTPCNSTPDTSLALMSPSSRVQTEPSRNLVVVLCAPSSVSLPNFESHENNFELPSLPSPVHIRTETANNSSPPPSGLLELPAMPFPLLPNASCASLRPLPQHSIVHAPVP